MHGHTPATSPHCRDLRHRALQELRLAVEAGYAAAEKRVQAAVFRDLLVAAGIKDGCAASRGVWGGEKHIGRTEARKRC